MEFIGASTLNIVLVAIGLYVLSSVRSWWRLRQFDGPWLGKFSYLWMARAELSEEMNLRYMALAKKYGASFLALSSSN
jgi:hypothetical protein